MDISDLDELKRKTQTSSHPIVNYIMNKFVTPKMVPAQQKLVAETMKHRFDHAPACLLPFELGP